MNKEDIKATKISRENNAFVSKIRYVQGAIKHDIKTKKMSALEKSLLNVRLLDLDLAIAKSFMRNRDSLKSSVQQTIRQLTNEEAFASVNS